MSLTQLYKLEREEAKKYYGGIGVLSCPALNEEVFFHNSGFRHLIYKETKFRPIPEQLKRFRALRHAKDILCNAISFSEYREEVDRTTTAYFWAFEKEIGKEKITVVLRKIDQGPLHFFSTRSQ